MAQNAPRGTVCDRLRFLLGGKTARQGLLRRGRPDTARRWLACAFLVVFALAFSNPEESIAAEKLRILIETDAGGDPDDEQSLVRFLLYANEWDIEGIIANRPTARPGENRNPERTGLGIVQRLLHAYGDVHGRLTENAAGYPTEEHLRARTVPGYATTEAGVQLIISAVDRDDPRPIWFQNWGTDHGSDPSNLRRALDKILAERGPEGYAKFKNRILLSSADAFGEHTSELKPAWRLWVEPTKPKMDGAFMYHRFGPITADAGGFDLARDVLADHGPLGRLYPTNTNIRQKEGDSAYFLYLVPTGMNDPLHPSWGSWAGRFGPRDDQQPIVPDRFWANVRDEWQGTTNRDNTLRRWAADLQNDFRARLDWCVKPFAEANHPPVARLNGDASKKTLSIRAHPGTVVRLNADGSSDPDGDRLTFEWSVYREAGTYPGSVLLSNDAMRTVNLPVPADASGTDLHVILTIRDNGDPPLSAYRRAIIRVTSLSDAPGR